MSSAPDRDEQLFAEALALPPAERAAFLARACAGDDALRQRIEALLAAGESAAGFMESPPEALPATAPEEQIGRYRLLQKIGEGGCGLVYMAEQSEPVRRRVALKIIKLGMDTREVIARFEAERQALALMDHPNIARVLDAGATASGRPYFVMELVRGIRITDYCDQHRLPTAQRLALFSQVCLAVQHAHQKGIIHRDLKPSNILVAHDDGAPVPKIIDFGIAKATQGRLTDLTLFTAFEQFIGTPAYMSPEQAEMSSLDVDTRSDIYSLGVLLYELVAGRPPFDPQSLRQAGIDEIRRLIREVEPPKPSTRLGALPGLDGATVASLRGTDAPRLSVLLRGDLDWIVMKAIEKNRARRYETAGAFAADIARHLHHEPVNARPPSTAYLLQKLIRRNRLAFAALGAVGTALLLGLAASLWSLANERTARAQAQAAGLAQSRARAEAEAEEKKARVAAAKSQQAYQFISSMLTGVGPSVAAGRDTALLKDILDKTVQRLEARLKDQPEVEFTLRATLGSVYLDLGDYPKAEAMARASLALAKKLHGEESEQAGSARIQFGQAHLMQGRLDEAGPLITRGLALARKFPGANHEALTGALLSSGHRLVLEGKLTEAEAHIREALALARENPDAVSIRADSVESVLAGVLQRQGRLAEAEPLFLSSLEAQKIRLGPEHPLVGYAHAGLANVQLMQGKLTEADGQLATALALLAKSIGPDHPNLLSLRFNRAYVWHQSGRLAEAEQLYREVLERQQQLLGPDHATAKQTETLLAMVLQQQRKSTEAEALQGAATPPPALSPEVTAALKQTDRAMAALSQGKFADTVLHLREALPVIEPALGPAHPAVVGSRLVLTQALLQAGKPTEAEPVARALLAGLRQNPGASLPALGPALSLLATSLQSQGKLPETEALLQECLALARGQTTDGRSPQVGVALLALATVKAMQAQIDDRDRLVSEAAGLFQSLPPHVKNTIHKSAELTATLLKDRGKTADAVAVQQVAVSLVRQLFSTDSDNTAWVLSTFSWLQNSAGQLAAGEATAREALAIRRRILPADHWLIPATEFTVGESLFKQKKYTEAETLFLAVFDRLQARGPENSDPLHGFWRGRLGYTANYLRALYEATDRPDQAAAWKAKTAAYPEAAPAQP